jgi:hypothetical protein
MPFRTSNVQTALNRAKLYAAAHSGEVPVICSTADRSYFCVFAPSTYEMMRDKLAANGWEKWSYKIPAPDEFAGNCGQLTFLEGLANAFRP